MLTEVIRNENRPRVYSCRVFCPYCHKEIKPTHDVYYIGLTGEIVHYDCKSNYLKQILGVQTGVASDFIYSSSEPF